MCVDPWLLVVLSICGRQHSLAMKASKDSWTDIGALLPLRYPCSPLSPPASKYRDRLVKKQGERGAGRAVSVL